MTEIKLTKRYPQSRAEDITDAFMRGYEQGKKDGLKVGKQIVLGAFETYINADRKTEPSFKVDEIGDDDTTIHAIAYLQKVGWLQEHDRALTEQTEPQRGCDADCTEDCTECAKEWQDWKDQMWAEAVEASKDEPQTERSE